MDTVDLFFCVGILKFYQFGPYWYLKLILPELESFRPDVGLLFLLIRRLSNDWTKIWQDKKGLEIYLLSETVFLLLKFYRIMSIIFKS